VGSVLSGLEVVRMGMALGVSVLIGVNAAMGAFGPMAINTPDIILTKKALMVILAVLTLLVGLAFVGVAGKQRELSQAAVAAPAQQGSFVAGLVICVITGIFSSLMNFAFAFGKPVSRAAASLAASESGALNLVRLIRLVASFVPTAIYACYLLTINHSWRNYRQPRSGRYWLVGLGMAMLWYMGVFCYRRGAEAMGRLGAVVGWPMFMAIMILSSSVAGFLTGEWKGASGRAKKWMAGGIIALMLASIFLVVANG
jgi:L-rhamnose-H+ transport protein